MSPNHDFGLQFISIVSDFLITSLHKIKCHEHFQTARKTHTHTRLDSHRIVFSGISCLLSAFRDRAQGNFPCRNTGYRITLAMSMADHAGTAFLCRWRLLRFMRKLPCPDGKLRACTRDVHSIFHRKILHESRARQKAHTEDERIPGHDRILHPGAPGGRFQSHRSSCGARNNPHRCHCIRMSDQHDDASGAPSAKQPIRSRRRDLRLLRFHPRLEQVRGADSLPQLPGPRPILPCPVAPIHPRHPIPSRPRNAHHAVLIHKKGEGFGLLLFCICS